MRRQKAGGRSQKLEGRGGVCARGRSRGFTLVEVLATVALMGVILPVAMYGVQISLQAASGARHRAEAATLAQSKLQEVLAEEMAAAIGGGSGAVGDGGDFAAEGVEGYRWECVRTPMDLNMQQIDVRVTWQQRGGERELVVSTWVYQSAMVQ